MDCPTCGNTETRVTRTARLRMCSETYRARVCPCGTGWSTTERIDKGSVRVVQGVPRAPLPPDTIAFVLARDNGMCRYCGTTAGRIGIDHVIPLSAPLAQGRTLEQEAAYRNSPDNLVACCPRCNSAKGDRVNGHRQGPAYVRPDTQWAAHMHANAPPQASNPPASAGGVGGGLSSGSDLGLFPESASSSGLSSNPDQTRARRKRRDAEYTSPQFVAFWGLYPRKIGKFSASTAWWRMGLDTIADKVMAGLRAQVPEFAGRPFGKVPHPTTWLNGRRWEDELPAAVATGWGHMKGIG